MLNQAQLIGHVGADPEISALPSGDRVANFSLATSESWKDKHSGERKEKTEWHRIRVFNQALVRVIENYVKKGARLYIAGAIRTRKYTDRDQVERYSTEIVLENFNGDVRLLDRAERSSPSPDDYGTTRSREGSGGGRSDQGGRGGGKPNYDLDDDIPF